MKTKITKTNGNINKKFYLEERSRQPLPPNLLGRRNRGGYSFHPVLRLGSQD